MSGKPLGGKAYGSIPHLPGSRLGPADHCCHEGQAAICTENKRDRHDVIVVQEKLDGSCVSVARLPGGIVALSRAGYEADSSPYQQHHLFAAWVLRNEERFDFLKIGQRVVGEWLAMAHGTMYELKHEPFVVFDLMDGGERFPYLEMVKATAKGDLQTPHLISYGEPLSIELAMKKLRDSGHGAIDGVEGAVWRVERKGKVEFLTKYVRQDKQDGKYFAENMGHDVWNKNVEIYLPEIAA